jgi:hypothetical protein
VNGNRVPFFQEELTALKSFNPMPFVIIGGACIAGVMRVDLTLLAIITGSVTVGVVAARLTPKLRRW